MEHLSASTEKEQPQTEFHEFVQEHLEFKNIDVNKHRYDLEINLFNSITPPVIYENNGSQKSRIPMKQDCVIFICIHIY